VRGGDAITVHGGMNWGGGRKKFSGGGLLRGSGEEGSVGCNGGKIEGRKGCELKESRKLGRQHKTEVLQMQERGGEGLGLRRGSQSECGPSSSVGFYGENWVWLRART